jgi:hypothetical protein
VRCFDEDAAESTRVPHMQCDEYVFGIAVGMFVRYRAFSLPLHK